MCFVFFFSKTEKDAEKIQKHTSFIFRFSIKQKIVKLHKSQLLKFFFDKNARVAVGCNNFNSSKG